MFKLRWSGLCEGEGLLWQLEQHLGCQARGRRFASSIHYPGYSESLRTFLFDVRLSNCTSDHFAVAPRVVFFMQAVEARRAARRERVSRDKGNPLDALNDFIEFYSRCRFRREELNTAIEPRTERNAAISSV